MKVALALGFAALLYEQAVVKLLHDRLPDERTSYILLELPEGRLVDSHWPDATGAVAVGSLVKPFTALAYGETHGFRYPEYTCRGSESGCWLPRGHGRVGIVEAIAHSCNAYFDALAAELRFSDVASVAQRFSIAPPPERAPSSAYAGRAGLWRIAPLDIARAYAKLLSDPDAAVPLSGMAQCALKGTGRGMGQGLIKTGTAPCCHSPKAPGDGFAVAVDRADAPRHLLLVRVHGVPGAEAVFSAREMMRIVREGK
jgi:hypothetical protein